MGGISGGEGSVVGEGAERMRRWIWCRSRRSRAGSKAVGKRTCRVKKRFLMGWFVARNFRGLDAGGSAGAMAARVSRMLERRRRFVSILVTLLVDVRKVTFVDIFGRMN